MTSLAQSNKARTEHYPARTIAGVRTVVVGAGWRNYIFDRLATDDGLTGLAEVAEVAASITIPVATGERLFTKWGFRDVLDLGAPSVPTSNCPTARPTCRRRGISTGPRRVGDAAMFGSCGVCPPQGHGCAVWTMSIATSLDVGP